MAIRRRSPGHVIAWCLHTEEILTLERRAEPDGLVVVCTHDDRRAWVTANQAPCHGGEPVQPVPEARSAIKAIVAGTSLGTMLTQEFIDPRERSMVIQALTYMRVRGHSLVPAQLTVEAIQVRPEVWDTMHGQVAPPLYRSGSMRDVLPVAYSCTLRPRRWHGVVAASKTTRCHERWPLIRTVAPSAGRRSR